jgi:hypothetical protein
MIPVYSKILKVPFDEIYRKNLCESIVHRHKKTLYSVSQELIDSDSFNLFEYLKQNDKLYVSGGQNFPLSSDYYYFNYYLYDEFYNICNKIYDDFSIINSNNFVSFPYVSSNSDFRGNIHNHTRTSVINGVYYLKVPHEGSGELNFYDDNEKLIYSHYPKTDELIIFPSYLNHFPQISHSEEYRIAINVEFVVPFKLEKPEEFKIKLIDLNE